MERSETSEGRGKRRNSVAPGPATAAFPIARFGSFRLIERIDKDGAQSGSELYRALWAQMPREPERLCVLKRLRPELVSSPTFVRMFEQEAQVQAALDHPNLVRTFERGSVETVPYLAMECLEGLDLSSLLRSIRVSSGTLPIEVGIFIAHEVACAIAHGHAARDSQGNGLGLVHRDIRPSKIVLLPSGSVKLIDFGLTRVSSFVAQNVNSEGNRTRPSYVAPEQIRGGMVDARVDLFSLGVVLWEMLTGRPLFPPADPRETAANLVTGELQRPSVLRSDVTPPLDALVMKLLQRDLNERYQTAISVVQDLALFLPAPADDARAVGSLVRSHMETRPAVAAPGPLLPSGKPVPPGLVSVFDLVVRNSAKAGARAGGLAGRIPGSLRRLTNFVPMVAAKFPRRSPTRGPNDPPPISIHTPAASFNLNRRAFTPVIANIMVVAALALGAGASWRYYQGQDDSPHDILAEDTTQSSAASSLIATAFVEPVGGQGAGGAGVVIESLPSPSATGPTPPALEAAGTAASTPATDKASKRVRAVAKNTARRWKRSRGARHRSLTSQAEAFFPAKK